MMQLEHTHGPESHKLKNSSVRNTLSAALNLRIRFAGLILVLTNMFGDIQTLASMKTLLPNAFTL